MKVYSSSQDFTGQNLLGFSCDHSSPALLQTYKQVSSNLRLPFWEDFQLQASLGSLPIINISPFFLTALPPLEYDLLQKKRKKEKTVDFLNYLISFQF